MFIDVKAAHKAFEAACSYKTIPEFDKASYRLVAEAKALKELGSIATELRSALMMFWGTRKGLMAQLKEEIKAQGNNKKMINVLLDALAHIEVWEYDEYWIRDAGYITTDLESVQDALKRNTILNSWKYVVNYTEKDIGKLYKEADAFLKKLAAA